MKANLEKWLVGMALGVAIPALLPVIRKTAKPLIKKGKSLTKQMIKQSVILATKAKHEVEDFLEEANYERMKRNWQRNTPTYVD
jgi:hypothetical protein